MSSTLKFPETTVREGTTDRIVMQLLADDEAIDLTGMDHVELEMKDQKKKTYRWSSDDVSPLVGVSDAAEGLVYLDPPTTLFKTVLSPYSLYWLVYYTPTTFFGVPEEGEGLILVRRNW